jgi:tetratricopeptide (TPR) repeat protein
MNDVAWVPVEVTERRGGFMKAWAEGAREWREAEAQGSAGFVSVRAAWMEYEPVQLPGSTEVTLPGNDAIVSAFLQEVAKFVDREIAPRVSQLQQDIKRTGGAPVAYNKLGVLYAQYGMLDEAEAAFRAAIGRQNYVPGILNLGNLYSLRNDWPRAREQYELAARLEPRSPGVLLALARVYYANEQYDLARAKLQELEKLDRSLAERYAYLGGAGEAGGERAGEAESWLRQIEWAE